MYYYYYYYMGHGWNMYVSQSHAICGLYTGRIYNWCMGVSLHSVRPHTNTPPIRDGPKASFLI